MADIRIKDLAVTASASSSDDYLAVDGATNGTRKLSAYSPTFGGNVVATGTLTVNGTTDSSSKDTGAIITEGGLGVEKSATIGGNLTVNAGAVLVDGPSLGGGAQVLRFNNTNTPNSNRWAFVQRSIAEGDLGLYDVNASAFRFYLNSAGNLLVGTTTDSANGKLQLATHTTSAGGIGFGTDLSLSRFSTSGLGINTTASTTGLLAIGNSGVTASGSAGLNLQLAVNDGYLWNRQNGPLYFGTNNTLALTLDSSQNATFAGSVSINSSVGATITTSSVAKFTLNSTAASGKEWLVQSYTDGSFYITHYGVKDAIRAYPTTGNVDIGGALAINNTVQTAVAVASTHKVTISIGGSTYYLLATNV